MKINLGCGLKRLPGYVNIDDDPTIEVDCRVNLDDVNIKLPFDDNTVEEILAHHILEHIGDGFIPLMKELYRVAKDGCVLDIIVPHHFHEVFYGDPTHKRPITVNGMLHFDKEHCDKHSVAFNSNTGIANKFGINFKMESYDFEYDPFYQPLIDTFTKNSQQNNLTQQDVALFQRLMREANNVAQHTIMKMRAVKDK